MCKEKLYEVINDTAILKEYTKIFFFIFSGRTRFKAIKNGNQTKFSARKIFYKKQFRFGDICASFVFFFKLFLSSSCRFLLVLFYFCFIFLIKTCPSKFKKFCLHDLFKSLLTKANFGFYSLFKLE